MKFLGNREDRLHRRLWAACRQLPLAVSLAINLFSLTALAAASPPDPSWIPGIYNGADGDDVVVMLTDMSLGVEPPASPVDVVPRPIVGGVIRLFVEWASAVPAALERQFRSPPLV